MVNHIFQQLELQFNVKELNNIFFSHPQWSEVQMNHYYGIIRDYPRYIEAFNNRKDYNYPAEEFELNQSDPVRKILNERYLSLPHAYDINDRIAIPKHVENYISIKQKSDIIQSNENGPQAFITIGNGNLFNNLGIIGYDPFGAGNLHLYSNWEQKRNSQLPYTCFAFTRKNASRENAIRIAKYTKAELLTMKNNAKNQKETPFDWFVSGQPILWDNMITSYPELLLETYDFRHIFHLPTSNGPNQQTNRLRFQTFMKDWLRVFLTHDKPHALAQELWEHAKNQNLTQIETNYIQSALGVDDSGNIYLLQMHGSMQEIASKIKAKGAKHEILLDQGGSVSSLYSTQSNAGFELEHRYLLRSLTHRASRLSTIILDLASIDWDES